MSLAGDRSSQGAVDKELRDFIETEARRQQFQALVHSLTDICWEVCVDRPAQRLETKVEKCLVNCVDRFIDTTNYVTNRLKQKVLSTHSELTVE